MNGCENCEYKDKCSKNECYYDNLAKMNRDTHGSYEQALRNEQELRFRAHN